MSEVQNQDLKAWGAPHQQTVFRQLMRAFSFPGRLETLSDGEALTQTLATLVDREATLADPQNLLDTLTLKRLQARMTAPELAQFIVADGSVPPRFEPCLGTLESPEGGATILLWVTALGEGAPWQLTGPGIATTQALAITGLDPAWLEHRQVWNEGFPLGVDLILIDANHVVALPRTTVATHATPMTKQGETPWAM
ncbi:MAG: phosphonate C-P lyase system protein PhnH [Rhodoferax sp.]|jgi:alpha-D-ribose 1-methylphosphonate 5-triphosphate synthase subunit PhnH|uniref:phosphonate C-P lyase system protein PhnH n=1 Tax=Comamonadaceae TaxID=80864 RepID=UPI00271A9AAF|nr:MULTISPECIES: phosphonate C-P lyase system protein PhnH [Comamonadaceae]MDO9143949.1 phosphonate C-P lyase system protein PhnH [Rhodoferax sp.]MDP1529349.1 phosphonate C-P lyase system protein PhnH [Rhodoferax sp.]MDP1945628.1 phosphonate C-P lyase system protein PhnH [Rhodoferax sp.]MDP3190110.1 phosphonate C-P lyase system protein PhnH [Rhodoferax sp.]MDP3335453.1 phosphonate C-P lyase system protein PhnH [Rhodoferax sp.]